MNARELTERAVGMILSEGLTKREYFAAMAMQGQLSAEYSSKEFKAITSAAVDYADALIEALNKPTLRKDQTKVEGE